jgi:hypothetical protein
MAPVNLRGESDPEISIIDRLPPTPSRSSAACSEVLEVFQMGAVP